VDESFSVALDQVLQMFAVFWGIHIGMILSVRFTSLGLFFTPAFICQEKIKSQT